MTVRFRKAHATVVDSAMFEAINDLKGHTGQVFPGFEKAVRAYEDQASGFGWSLKQSI